MLTTILSSLCALTLSGNIATAQADTLNVYMINGDKITNFDGSQLVGKTVSEYRIGIATNNAGLIGWGNKKRYLVCATAKRRQIRCRMQR